MYTSNVVINNLVLSFLNASKQRKVLRQVLYEKLLETHKSQLQQQHEHEKTSYVNHEGIVKGTAIYWNHSLIDYRYDELTQQYQVRFRNKNDGSASSSRSKDSSDFESIKHGTIVNTTADLLVAADGIRSSVLQQLYNENRVETAIISSSPISSNDAPKINIRDNPELYGLRPMSIRAILGISNIDHPLLRERGFYTVDSKGHRLFTMPYQSNRFQFGSNYGHNGDGSNESNQSKNWIMWQLSFSTVTANSDEALAKSRTSSLDPTSLREYALRIFSTWHSPVQDILSHTPIQNIWGTDLMDRNPRDVYEQLIVGYHKPVGTIKNNSSPLRQPRLAVVGDALHSMSMFKGQGANQALADGPLLSKCLVSSSIDAALTNWWRETLNRTAPIVSSSRKAALNWHSKRILEPNKDRVDRNGSNADEDYHGFAGVRPCAIPLLVEELRKRNIGPHLGGDLDRMILETIRDNDWFDYNNCSHNSDVESTDINENKIKGEKENKKVDICQRVLTLASEGDTAKLRQLTLSSIFGSRHQHLYCKAMVEAKDEQGRSCLHLATINNHKFTVKWLLAEMRVLKQEENQSDLSKLNVAKYPCGSFDNCGKSAYDYALGTENTELIDMFRVVMRDEKREKLAMI